MHKSRLADTILLADDEPYNLQWLVEYLGAKGFSTKTYTTVDEACDAMEYVSFRMVITDLSIPVIDRPAYLVGKNSLLSKYPGLIVAERARNLGHTSKQVLVYSVHDDETVEVFATQLRCAYVQKGRPRAFKAEIDKVLSFDPFAK